MLRNRPVLTPGLRRMSQVMSLRQYMPTTSAKFAHLTLLSMAAQYCIVCESRDADQCIGGSAAQNTPLWGIHRAVRRARGQF